MTTENEFIQQLKTICPYEIIPQHRIIIIDGCKPFRKLDAYCPKLNTAFEFHEDHHFQTILEDDLREIEIITSIPDGVIFFTVWQHEWDSKTGQHNVISRINQLADKTTPCETVNLLYQEKRLLKELYISLHRCYALILQLYFTPIFNVKSNSHLKHTKSFVLMSMMLMKPIAGIFELVLGELRGVLKVRKEGKFSICP
jgi:hypothetical protein